MEHAIRKHLKVHFEEDPALYQRLSEKLDSLIQKHKDDWDNLFSGLAGLRTEVEAGRKDGVEGLTARESPFYDRIGQIAYGGNIPADHANRIKELVRDTLALLHSTIGIIDFWSNGYEVDKLKGALSDLVLLTELDPIIATSELLVTEITALAKIRHQDILK